jgi:hypothetical protein
MYKLTKFISAAALMLLAVMTVTAQQARYQGSYQSVRDLILRIDNQVDVFRSDLTALGQRGRVYDSSQQQDLNRLLSDFDNSVYRLRTRFERRQATTQDVQSVLNLASQMDARLNQQQLNTRSRNSWENLRSNVSELARTFGLSWSRDTTYYPGRPGYPNQPGYPTQPGYRTNQLTGTYRLDPSRSDDPADAADRAARSQSSRDSERLRNRLMTRLESPDQIAIERRGRTVTIASSRAPQITFEADGTPRTETTPNGRTMTARATLSGDQLNVTTNGDRDNEFGVTFNPIDNGRRLSVTRRVYLTGLTRPVVVQSVYEKVSDVARFDIYNGSQSYPAAGSNTDFILTDGETVVGELDQLLSTETAREGDRFTMIVRQPSSIAGATVEGHVSNVERSGRLTGRSQMTFNFDSIRLSDGRSYRFAGLVESVRTPSGEVIKVDNEGAVREDSQTNKTAQRAAIGTAVGAIIGAIAGGGKGAAIGAIIGAGGGAGSVYVQGRDELQLDRGTELTIRASSPVARN